jgi:serine/threonine protein phosphatase PrpC
MPRPIFSAEEPKQFRSVKTTKATSTKARIAERPDRIERASDRLLAAVTDRGKSYPKNEDDVRVRKTILDATRVAILVTCDGVSSGQHADLASQTAASAASDFLYTSLRLGGDPREAMRQAILTADSAVRKIEYDASRGAVPPGSTIVAAIAIRKRLIVGWIGDSRCYLIDKKGAALLTHDHSWVNEVVDSGIMSHEEALRSREAHQISRCIGPLHGNRSSDIAEPEIAVFDLPDYGMVLLCTDGLWNYVPTMEQMASLVKIGPGSPDAIIQARSLVDYALQQGGKDNISVAILVK